MRQGLVESLEYEGGHTFWLDEAFLVDVANGALLPLSPLIFWDACPQHAELEATVTFSTSPRESRAISHTRRLAFPARELSRPQPDTATWFKS
jgi:hypothetical protein